MSGPVTAQLSLHGRSVLRVVVEADIHHLVVQEERGQPPIEGDFTRTCGYGDATSVFLPDTQRIMRDLDALRGQQVHQVRQIRQWKRTFSLVNDQRGGFSV